MSKMLRYTMWNTSKPDRHQSSLTTNRCFRCFSGEPTLSTRFGESKVNPFLFSSSLLNLRNIMFHPTFITIFSILLSAVAIAAQTVVNGQIYTGGLSIVDVSAYLHSASAMLLLLTTSSLYTGSSAKHVCVYIYLSRPSLTSIKSLPCRC
jgi:hypothetical protein